jgi:hypothetical protein
MDTFFEKNVQMESTTIAYAIPQPVIEEDQPEMLIHDSQHETSFHNEFKIVECGAK